MKAFVALLLALVAYVSCDSSIAIQPSSASQAYVTASTESLQGASAQIVASSAAMVGVSPSASINVQPVSSTAPVQAPKSLKLNFKMDETWSADLSNSSSSAFIAMAANIKNAFDQAYENDTDYISTEVKQFTNGSVNVELVTKFKAQVADGDLTSSKIAWFTNGNGTIVVGGYTCEKNSMTSAIVADGQWSAWQNSGGCDASTSKQNQTRTCTPATGGGQPCAGSTTQQIDCTPAGSDASTLLCPVLLHMFALLFGKHLLNCV